jgi:hypothetical protein
VSADPFAPREQGIQVDLKNISVMLGMPAGRDLHPLVVKSMLATQSLCRDVGVPFSLGMVIGSSVVQWARDEVVDVFLKSDCTRLFWVDSDIEWKPEDFLRMLALSQHHNVIGATYPAKCDPPTFYVNRDEKLPLTPNEWGLLKVWGVGLGFTVMHRSVVAELAGKAPRIFDEVAGRDLAAVFRIDHIEKDGRRSRRGEDMAFFADLRALGHTIWLDREIDLGHIGTKTYRGAIREALALQ